MRSARAAQQAGSFLKSHRGGPYRPRARADEEQGRIEEGQLGGGGLEVLGLCGQGLDVLDHVGGGQGGGGEAAKDGEG